MNPILTDSAHQIRKRPPPRSSIPSPYANSSSPKVVYISSKTPFISAVKRVRQLLSLADKRALGRINLEQKASDRQLLQVLAEEKQRKERGESEAVIIKGTGKAIEKVLQLALYFQGQPDCRMQLKTGSLKVVDDIVEKDGFEADVEEEEEDTKQDEEDVPEFQVRTISVLEAAIMLR